MDWIFLFLSSFYSCPPNSGTSDTYLKQIAHFKERGEEELDSNDMDILLIHTMAKHSKAVKVSNMSPPNLFIILLSISKESNERKSFFFQKILSLEISLQMTISSENENNNEFIRWFHDFSVTTNLRIFRETEFVLLFLCTVNVNSSNIPFRVKDS